MSKDTIYRQDAVSEIHKYFCEEIDSTSHGTDEDGEDVYTDMPTVNSLLAYNKQLSKRIKALPSAHPKKGQWIKMSDSDGDYYCCNNCGEELQRYITEVPTWDRPYPSKHSIDRTDWCPSCGAKMERAKE